MSEEWRVILEDGEEREVLLMRSHMVGAPWVPNGDGLCGAADPRIAVAAYAVARACPVRDIRGPGEPTSEELAEDTAIQAELTAQGECEEAIAKERDRCAKVCRDVSEVHAAMIRWDDSPESHKAEAAMECADAIEKGSER